MPLPDNRLRFSSNKIDFVADVGTTSQDHDNYPPPQGQARYDHLRMAIIALLSQQSSYDEPSQYRDGTPWFDLNSSVLKIRSGGNWVPIGDVIGLGNINSSGNYKSLSEWYSQVETTLSILAPEITFSGVCNADSINIIPIPTDLQPYIENDTRAFVYVNGLLIPPKDTSIVGFSVKINGILIDTNDNYTVIMRRVTNNTFVNESVDIP